jgi:hypothetical protein
VRVDLARVAIMSAIVDPKLMLNPVLRRRRIVELVAACTRLAALVSDASVMNRLPDGGVKLRMSLYEANLEMEALNHGFEE